MPLPLPHLDSRRWQDLVEEAETGDEFGEPVELSRELLIDRISEDAREQYRQREVEIRRPASFDKLHDLDHALFGFEELLLQIFQHGIVIMFHFVRFGPGI